MNSPAAAQLLERLPFPVGYGIEIATLIDALDELGLDALAECQLGSRQNRHQSLRALGEMAFAVLAAVERRIDGAAQCHRRRAPAPVGGRSRRPRSRGRATATPLAAGRRRHCPAAGRLTGLGRVLIG